MADPTNDEAMESSHRVEAKMTDSKLPEWAAAPLREFLDFSHGLDDVVHLSIRGISIVQGTQKAIDVLSEIEIEAGRMTLDAAEQRRQRAKKEADLATREVERDFPLLHSQAVVALWSGLESMIRNVLVAWLANDPARVLSADKIANLKVRLGEYEMLSKDDRAPYLAELIERHLDAPLRTGVSRFEEVLAVVGLTGPIKEDIRKTLFEMANVRNAIVHSAGIADRHLIAACPWLGAVGKPLGISHDMFASYMSATHDYLLECVQRTRVYFGLNRYSEGQGGGNGDSQKESPADGSEAPDETR